MRNYVWRFVDSFVYDFGDLSWFEATSQGEEGDADSGPLLCFLFNSGELYADYALCLDANSASISVGDFWRCLGDFDSRDCTKRD